MPVATKKSEVKRDLVAEKAFDRKIDRIEALAEGIRKDFHKIAKILADMSPGEFEKAKVRLKHLFTGDTIERLYYVGCGVMPEWLFRRDTMSSSYFMRIPPEDRKKLFRIRVMSFRF